MTLYEQLGGKDAIHSVVDKFYEFMLADETVAGFFKSIDMKKQTLRQKQFITMVTGGPMEYEGVDMKKAHEKLAIKQEHFDATWKNLLKSLEFHKVPEKQIEEVKKVVYSTQDDIVNTKWSWNLWIIWILYYQFPNKLNLLIIYIKSNNST